MKIAFLLACTISGYTFAQPPEEKARDLAYCQALATKYRTYVESQDARRPTQMLRSLSTDAKAAIRGAFVRWRTCSREPGSNCRRVS